MIRKFFRELFEDMAHGYSYDKNGNRIGVEDDYDWDGCPHGVIEGTCHQCAGISEEEARRRDNKAWEQVRQSIREDHNRS
jgi:hypothetical protein